MGEDSETYPKEFSSKFHPEHIKDLARSGLSDQTIQALGIHTVLPREIPKHLGFNDQRIESLLCFPYPGLDGFCRDKVFPPIKGKDGHTRKYLQRKESGVHLYIPSRARAALNDPTIPLYFTEGEKKAAKGDQEDYPTIGLGGLWNWMQNGQPIAELDQIAWSGRKVFLAPDSDTWKREELKHAVYALGKELERRGAVVAVLKIPQKGKDKVGLDDLLMSEGAEALKKLDSISLDDPAFKKARARDKKRQGKKAPDQAKRKKAETGEDVLTNQGLQPRLHPAMEWQDGVLIVGFHYGEKSVWVTSKRELLSEAQLKEMYGEPRTSPLNEGPSKEACFRWKQRETIDGRELYQRILNYLRRHVVFQYPWQADVATLWVLNTYLYRIHPVCPALHVTAPEKASGKTRFLDVTAAISFGHPQLQVDPTESVLFRQPELTALPLFWDEAEALREARQGQPDDRRAIINASYRKGATVMRVEKNTLRITTHEVYRPMVLSGITRLPDTTASRSLTLELQRKKASEKIEDFNPSRLQQETTQMRDDCYLWALGNASDVAEAYRVGAALPIPEAAHGRLREILEPLFATALAIHGPDLNGPTITALRDAATHLAGISAQRETEESARIQLLQILHENFPPDVDRWALKAETCLTLCQENGMDWIERKGQVQRILNSWNWKSSTGRIEGKVTRAYYISRQSLHNHVERYAPHLLTPRAPNSDGYLHPEG